MAGFIFLVLLATLAHIIPSDSKSVVSPTWSGSSHPQDLQTDFDDVELSARLAARGVNGSDGGAVPWQVSIIMEISPVIHRVCAGSLYSLDRVLTSARCTQSFDWWHAVLHFGSSFVFGNNDTTSPEVQSRTVKERFIHPEYYSRSTLENDIAILVLDTPVQLTATVYPISLPGPQDAAYGNYVGKEATVSGWGTTHSGMNETMMSDWLQTVTVEVISNEDCADSTLGALIIDSHICTTGMGGGGICVGDTGSALTYNDVISGPVQIGIVSFVSAEGCEVDMPSGYTRITEHLAWIADPYNAAPNGGAVTKTSVLAILLAVMRLL